MIELIFPYISGMLRRLPNYILYILSIYITGIAVFTVFRLVLIFTNLSQLFSGSIPGNEISSLLFQAMFMGLRFDTVISGYLLIVPIAVLGLTHIVSFNRIIVNRITAIFISTVYPLAFLLSALDIPFFNHFMSRLNAVIFSWAPNMEFGLKMTLQEPNFYLFIFLYAGLAFAFIRVAKIAYKKNLEKEPESDFNIQPVLVPVKRFILFLVFLAITIILIRGRIAEKNPIVVGTAFFSDYPLINQLGLNPVFTLLRSILDENMEENRELNLMDTETAKGNVRKWFHTENNGDNSPVSRKVSPDTTLTTKPNVVLVIMESMTANKLKRFGNPLSVTPNLDSLANNSYCFENIYSAGIHTFNGIYGTLFSHPALLKKHPMEQVNINKYTGFSKALSLNGYSTTYFTTHDDQFDNVAGFLKNSYFDEIISQKDYPKEQVMSTLGVPDQYMFEFAIPKLTEKAATGKPFFTAFMTASDHEPYIIPKNTAFKAKQKDHRNPIIEYADWSIGHFIELASKEPWFDNTIFIFIADHGGPYNDYEYHLVRSMNHVPLIIHSPKLLKPKTLDAIGGQIDVFPTVMDILQLPYVNNTLGVNLLKEERPYMYFSADDKIGCIDKSYYYVKDLNGPEYVYKYKTPGQTNYLKEYQSKADSMRTYAYSMLQTSQWMIQNRLTE